MLAHKAAVGSKRWWALHQLRHVCPHARNHERCDGSLYFSSPNQSRVATADLDEKEVDVDDHICYGMRVSWNLDLFLVV